MATTTKTPKQVKILARYIHKTDGKPNGRISYLVRSSDGKSEYCTTLQDGHATGCSCPSRKPCYHEKQLEQKEAGRPFASKRLPVWAVWLVESGVLVAPAKAARVVELPAQKVASSVEPLADKIIQFKKDWGKPARQKEDWTETAAFANNRAFKII